ncbi:MAG TPA: ABC transporter ATP-binding protein [Candidatus Caccoplasma merdavium]|nr:ABC transporter ATP-binding protein [Candidatus Caccoplasma merdavium]
MNTTAVIEGRRVTLGYREGKERAILFSDMDFSLYRGELTALLGINGAGKSTLLRTMSATQPCLSGEIRLGGKDLSALSEQERAQRIGVVFTEKHMAGGLRVHELVALGRYPYTGFFGRLDRHDRERVKEVMALAGIAHKRDAYLSQLSDGERQKAFIAKALAQESDVILLDEPTAFLDLPSRIETMMLLHRLAEECGKTILLSTHDVEQALVLADRLWLLSPQYGLECGVTEDLILSGRLDRLFPSDTIRFDPEHGSYYPLVHSCSPVMLRADNATLLHWGINLLNRNGFSCLIDKDKATSPGEEAARTSDKIPYISIEANDRITLTSGAKRLALDSFAALADAVKELKG